MAGRDAAGPVRPPGNEPAVAQWKVWDEQIETLETEIKKRQAENATAAVVATIPGCAAYSSLALAARISAIERFPRPASLANYWGLTPGCRNSGEVTDRLGSITKQGSARPASSSANWCCTCCGTIRG